MPESTLPPGSDEEWNELLRRLPLPAAPQQPFFYSRVRARLVASAATPLFWLPRWLRRPAYATLLGLLILAVSRDGASIPTAQIATHPVRYAAP